MHKIAMVPVSIFLFSLQVTPAFALSDISKDLDIAYEHTVSYNKERKAAVAERNETYSCWKYDEALRDIKISLGAMIHARQSDTSLHNQQELDENIALQKKYLVEITSAVAVCDSHIPKRGPPNEQEMASVQIKRDEKSEWQSSFNYALNYVEKYTDKIKTISSQPNEVWKCIVNDEAFNSILVALNNIRRANYLVNGKTDPTTGQIVRTPDEITSDENRALVTKLLNYAQNEYDGIERNIKICNAKWPHRGKRDD